MTGRPEIVHHVLRHVRRNREADADVAAGRREDLRVDADQFPVEIHEGAAGITLIDRRIGLQEILVAARPSARLSPFGADDSHGHRLADAERVADCEDDVADLDYIRVTHRNELQVGAVDLQQCEIARGIAADERRHHRSAVRQLDADVVGVVDHVMVRQNVPVSADDDA